ncbi:MAG: hypothetical protein F9K40_16220 [Kofleriaceae bacterium]|nr:MAG: hypothetical protein F9K40_16220 [Kofleriaceae bacterium]
MPPMRTAIAFASLVAFLAACGDNQTVGGDPDAAEVDAAPPTDARVDAMVDANCPVRSQGEVGGPCTTSAQCATGATPDDDICLNEDGVVPWPSAGFCITEYEACTQDSECGAGNVCVRIDDPDGAFNACLPACGTAPCECPNGQACSNTFAGSMMDKNACIPGNRAAIDGDACTTFGECDVDSICRANAEHPGGQCIQIGCTEGMDNTCTSGGDGHCADPGFISSGTGCLDTCTNDSDCRLAEGYKCFDAGGSIGKYCRHPQAGDPCTVDTDCGEASIWACKTGAGFPGGYCTLEAACNPTNGTGCTSGSSICYDPPVPAGTADAYCVDRCEGVAQGTCRTGYVCTPMGATASGCI